MFKFMRKKRNNDIRDWLDALDDESKQETVIKYLRSLDKNSLKRLNAAVELYRQADIELSKVVDPEGEENESESTPSSAQTPSQESE